MRISILAYINKDGKEHYLSVELYPKDNTAEFYIDNEKICTVLLDDAIRLAKIIPVVKNLISE